MRCKCWQRPAGKTAIISPASSRGFVVNQTFTIVADSSDDFTIKVNVTGKDAPGVVAADQRILALEVQDRDIALLVDMVDAVGPKETIRGTNLETTAARWADGLCAVRGNVVGLLAVDRLVADLDRLFE